MAAEWFCQARGLQLGPVDPAELRRLVDAGVVKPDTLVRRGADGRWVRAEKVAWLFGESDLPPQPAVRDEDKSLDRQEASSAGAEWPPKASPTLELPTASPIESASVASPSDVKPAPPGPEEVDRIHPVTWAAIIAGAGTVLMLLWALVFRGGIEPAARNGEFSASMLFKRISPSVVWVNNYDNTGTLVGFGSGFLVSREGHVATNLHVIEDAHDVTIRFHDGTIMPLRGIVGFDEFNDLALLKIDGSGHDFIRLSPELPEVGTRVYAIGNPEGLANTLSEGIVSGLVGGDKAWIIQTTAAISPGSSGGPLLSSDGIAVGVISSFLPGGQALNLAVPAHALRSLLDQAQQPVSLAELDTMIDGVERQDVATQNEQWRNSAFAYAARLQIEAFETPLEAFHLDIGDFPSTAQGLEALVTPPPGLANPDDWGGPYLRKGIPLDPWKNPFQYAWPAKVWSWGPDGIADTEDDIIP